VSDYQGSETHKNNARIAAKSANLASQIKASKLREEYYKNPNICKTCNSVLDFYRRANKFCSKSCSAKHNNIGRTHSIKTKEKISQTVKSNITDETREISRVNIRKLQDAGKMRRKTVVILTCTICTTKFEKQGNHTRKTCSRECAIIAAIGQRTYQNGSRKPVWYFNQFEQKSVLLDSSWEVITAELLDKLNIEWLRPKPLKWIDSSKKSHLYFPDFYIPNWNVYLDPKNPYCMDQDKEKIQYFVYNTDINIIFGPLLTITDFIEKMVGVAEFESATF
jgi:hypothetical protein